MENVERALLTSSLSGFKVVSLSLEKLTDDLPWETISVSIHYQFDIDGAESSSQGALHLEATVDVAALPPEGDTSNPVATLKLKMTSSFSLDLPSIDVDVANKVHALLDEKQELRGILWSKVFPAVREVMAFNLTKIGIEAAASMPWSFDSGGRKA